MAQRIIGLDIGSYSIKVAYLESTVRSFQVVGFRELRLPVQTETGPWPRAAIQEALRAWRMAEKGPIDAVVCAFPGDRAMARFLELPFKDRKRIAETIGFQIESQLPVDLAEIIYDYEIVRQSETGSRLMTVTAAQSELRAFLDLLTESGLDPKMICFAPAVYANLARYLEKDPQQAFAVLDIGHRHTNICMVREGRCDGFRTLSRGGWDLTHAIATQLQIDEFSAETLKQHHGGAPGFCLDQRLDPILSQALAPLARDIHLALHAYQSSQKVTLASVYLCGGSAQLRGIQEYLAARIEPAVAPLLLTSVEFQRSGNSASAPAADALLPQAVASAMRCVGGRAAATLIDLRQGPLAYKGQYQFLRDKVKYFAFVALILAVVGALHTYFSHRSVSNEYESLQSELLVVTKRVFGQEVNQFDKALEQLRKGPTDQGAVLPDTTAFQIFFDITTYLNEVKALKPPDSLKSGDAEATPAAVEGPAGPKEKTAPEAAKDEAAAKDGEGTEESAPTKVEQFNLEFESVTIDKKQGSIKGEANTVEAYEAFYQKLEAHPCLTKVQTTERKRVTFKRHEGWQKFQVKFQIECTSTKKTRKKADETAGTLPPEEKAPPVEPGK